MTEKKDYVIEMSHNLNLMRSAEFGVNELKILDKYMSRINPRDKRTRKVTFSLEEFREDLEITKVNSSSLKANVQSLLGRVVFIPNIETGEFVAFQLFKRLELKKDNERGWIIILDCHDDALQLFFDIAQNGYFSRKLKYSMRLNSVNQIKLYMLMKEYQSLGSKTIRISELKDWLKVNPKMEWKYFKRDVIDVTQDSLQKLTDVGFTYECTRVGRKYDRITFHIFAVPDQLALKDYENYDEIYPVESYKQEYREIAQACEFSFSEKELQIIHLSICKMFDSMADEANFLRIKYAELMLRMARTDLKTITNKFGYFKCIIAAEISQMNLEKENQPQKIKNDISTQPSYDLDLIFKHARDTNPLDRLKQ